MKKLINVIFFKIIKINVLAKFLLRTALKTHNISYQVSGILSTSLEPNKIHPKHRLMRYHDWFASNLNHDWHVLDIGCGNGALDYKIKPYCRSITAIDIDKYNIKNAKDRFSREGIIYICADALTYENYEKNDAIILSNVLEHIEKRIEFLKRIYEWQNQKRPPILLLRVPMITRDWISMYKKEFGVEWRLDHSHYTEYSLEQVFDELSRAGLEIESYNVQYGEFYGIAKKASDSDQ